MNIFSWNVNGIRAVEKKGSLAEFLASKTPDITCFQEIKIDGSLLKKEDFDKKYPDYFKFYSHAERKGYAGTAIWSKIQPIRVIHNFPRPILNDFNLSDTFGDASLEGRICGAEFADFWLLTVYTPNTKNDLGRLKLRKNWDKAFLTLVKGLENGEFHAEDFEQIEVVKSEQIEQNLTAKPVIFCGDLNVAHAEIDLANPKQNVGKHGFTNEERAGFSEFLANGLNDIFREQNPNTGQLYTWWSHFAKSRERNVGWRIDYFLHSSALKSKIGAAKIHPEVMGSDHCPVSIEVK